MRLFIALCFALTIACTATAADLPADLISSEAPADAVGIIAAKASAKPGDPIVVRGVVGGREKPFIGNRAMLVLVDHDVPLCDEFCCADPDQLKAGIATVQVVDADGRAIPAGLSGVGGLAIGNRIIVAGTVAPISSPEALVINATRIHIEPRQ